MSFWFFILYKKGRYRVANWHPAYFGLFKHSLSILVVAKKNRVRRLNTVVIHYQWISKHWGEESDIKKKTEVLSFITFILQIYLYLITSGNFDILYSGKTSTNNSLAESSMTEILSRVSFVKSMTDLRATRSPNLMQFYHKFFRANANSMQAVSLIHRQRIFKNMEKP